jgi:hypothetical protein
LVNSVDQTDARNVRVFAGKVFDEIAGLVDVRGPTRHVLGDREQAERQAFAQRDAPDPVPLNPA